MSCAVALELDAAVTKDAFHRGAFHLIQPAKGAHRSGIDAMLIAACVPRGFDGILADFGAGAGAAALAVLARESRARALLIEREPLMVKCAHDTLRLEENAAMSDRASIVDADLAQLPDNAVQENSLDWVIMNPPFNDASDRQTPHETKSVAHVMDDDLLELWIRKAATVLHAKGSFSVIARPESLHDILNAGERRFGALRVTPVQPRPDQDAIRIIVQGTKGSKKRLQVTAPLILHDAMGTAFAARSEALINGLETL